jgi:hypothetical protein
MTKGQLGCLATWAHYQVSSEDEACQVGPCSLIGLKYSPPLVCLALGEGVSLKVLIVRTIPVFPSLFFKNKIKK